MDWVEHPLYPARSAGCNPDPPECSRSQWTPWDCLETRTPPAGPDDSGGKTGGKGTPVGPAEKILQNSPNFVVV